MTAEQLSKELAHLARHSKAGVNLQVSIEHRYLKFMAGGSAGMYFPIMRDGLPAPDYGKPEPHTILGQGDYEKRLID